MKKLLSTLLLALLPALTSTAYASEGGPALDRAPDRSADVQSLQRGAKLFVNYCLNCHGAQSMRYNRLQDIGWAVQSYVEPKGYSVVRNFVGHGIGHRMHEDPAVPNYGEPGKGLRLKPGLVLAIEPMINAGLSEVEVLADKWTAVTKDRSLSAHFEHSVAVTEEGPLVLSRA